MIRRLVIAVLVAAAATAQSPTVSTIVNHGPTANRFDLVVLGDGYTSAEEPQFNIDAVAFANSMSTHEPYATFWNYINVHTVFRASAQSGANQPDVVPPIVVNNAYGATFNTGGTPRCLYITDTTRASIDAALAPANEGRVMVLVNDARYGGCTGQFAVAYNGPLMSEVAVHESCHLLGLTADEYDYPNSTYTGSEPAAPNITTSPVGQKWSAWWGSNGVSAFQGAGTYLYGLFRPCLDCLMRDLGQPFCPVCAEQLVLTVNGVVNNVDQPSPATPTLTLGTAVLQTFSFTSLAPTQDNAVVTWSVDGTVQAGQTGTSFVFDTSTVAAGSHTVAVAQQDPSPFVRTDPANAMNGSFAWTVSVMDPNLPDLHAIAVASTPVFAQAGQSVDLVTTVRNDGLAAVGTFRIEHFLSTDNVLTMSDAYLGYIDVPALAPGQQLNVTHWVQLPYLMTQSVHYLFAVIDRADNVPEVDETNNIASGAIVATAPPCTPALEFRDDLLYPRDSGTLSLAAGGTLLPTVIARCAAPGTAYVIVWGCSGTSPGTNVAPGITVPLNQDPCTQLGLAALNSPVFAAFFGTLDASGVGYATLNWPPALPVGPFTSNFAALLIDSSPQFVATTNAIAVDFHQ
jgi:hypothetical protein